MFPVSALVPLAFSCVLASALLSLAVDRHPALNRRLVLPLLGSGGALAAAASVLMLTGSSGFVATLPLGLPWLHWHLRVDPLSGFFLGVIGVVTTAVAVFAPGYLRGYRRGPYPLSVLGLGTGLFVAGMMLVVIADDAFTFMVAWELMSVASYFLVAFEHHESANRRAAFLYLLMAQLGAVLILLTFGILASHAGGFSFDAFRAVALPDTWATLAFLLGLFGFGMKAGLVPLHVWLPEAHPVAPSHVSALMSGVMLKVAVYGFIRLLFDLLGGPQASWGIVLLVAGSVTALYGVLYALVQHDLKRLLAYHSVENIGIIYIGIGLAAIFFGSGHPALGVLGLIAALYHTLNHALFKSLLFLGAGAIHQQSRERDLERMGGLLNRLPWTGSFFLVGCISISALPPFNGFASEWLTFQTALQATSLQSGVLRALIPISAAMLALTGALAAACFVKVYGIAFLGVARTRHVARARETDRGMVLAQGGLAALCLLFGVLPTSTVTALNRVTESLTGFAVTAADRHGWLWLTPVSPAIASYSAPLVLLGVALALGVWAAVWLGLRRRRSRSPVPRRAPWECGFGPPNARMQYSATAFAMPIRQIFQPLFRLQQECERETDPAAPHRTLQLRYQMHAEDITWAWFYLPVEHLVHAAARRVGRLQTGRIRHYLGYSFVTLLVLLWIIT